MGAGYTIGLTLGGLHELLFTLFGHRNTLCAKIPFNCVERKILHPTLVNVVLHRDAEAFEGGMFVNVGLKRLALDVFFSLGFYWDDSFFCLDGEIYLAF